MVGSRQITAGAVAVALVYAGYAYFGWNAVAYVAGEVREPARTLPRALVAGTALVTVLYLALNVVFLWAVPPSALADRIEVAHIAAGALFGPTGARLLSSLVALAVAGCVSAMLMAGPRITVAMAEDGVFFRTLARRSARGAPTAAVALQGALAAVAALAAAFDPILVYVGFTLNLTAGAAVVAAFTLRRREPAAERPHRALGWPFSGLLFLGLVGTMTVFAVRDRPWESAAGLATLATGGVAYAIWQAKARQGDQPSRPSPGPSTTRAAASAAAAPACAGEAPSASRSVSTTPNTSPAPVGSISWAGAAAISSRADAASRVAPRAPRVIATVAPCGAEAGRDGLDVGVILLGDDRGAERGRVERLGRAAPARCGRRAPRGAASPAGRRRRNRRRASG